MLSYYLKCRKNTESKSLNVVKTKKRKSIFFYQNVQCAKKSRFIKELEAIVELSSLGIKIPLSQIILVGPISFYLF